MKIRRLNEGTSNLFAEGYMSRDAMIAELRKAGLPYTFGRSFSDKQIYAMYQKYVVNAPQNKREKMEDEIDRTQNVEEIVGNGELVGRIEQGKFNVYQGEDIVGSFDSQADAEDAGYNVFESLKETVEKLHTKPNGEYLVKADSGKGYTAFNRNDVAIGGIDDEDADSDDKAIAKFKKNEYSECLNEEYFDTAEYRIQKYEDDIPELMAGMHDDYMEGKLDATRYAEVLKKVYDALAECDYKNTLSTPVTTNVRRNSERILDKLNEETENVTLPIKLKSFIDEICDELGTSDRVWDRRFSSHDYATDGRSSIGADCVMEAVIEEFGEILTPSQIQAAYEYAEFMEEPEWVEETEIKDNESLNDGYETNKCQQCENPYDVKKGELIKKKTNEAVEYEEDEVVSVESVASSDYGTPEEWEELESAETMDDAREWCNLTLWKNINTGKYVIIIGDNNPWEGYSNMETFSEDEARSEFSAYLDDPMYNSDDYDDDYSDDYDESLEECSGIKAHKVIMGEGIDDSAEFDDLNGVEGPQGDKTEDIEFVMSEYVAESFLLDFVEKVDPITYKVGADDQVVTVVFDPKWSEYVYTIDGKGPYSHRSYEFIARDIYDYVMLQRVDNSELDDIVD